MTCIHKYKLICTLARGRLPICFQIDAKVFKQHSSDFEGQKCSFHGLFWEVIIASLELAVPLIFLYLSLSLSESLTVCPWLHIVLASLQHTNNISHFSCWRFPPTVCYLRPAAGFYLLDSALWRVGCPPGGWHYPRYAWSALRGTCHHSRRLLAHLWWCHQCPHWRWHIFFLAPVSRRRKKSIQKERRKMQRSAEETARSHGDLKEKYLSTWSCCTNSPLGKQCPM